MRYIITENKVTKVIQRYFDNLISKPEFDWVDKIEIIPGTTEENGWSVSEVKPKKHLRGLFQECSYSYITIKIIGENRLRPYNVLPIRR